MQETIRDKRELSERDVVAPDERSYGKRNDGSTFVENLIVQLLPVAQNAGIGGPSHSRG
jgi:hypothetical protein